MRKGFLKKVGAGAVIMTFVATGMIGANPPRANAAGSWDHGTSVGATGSGSTGFGGWKAFHSSRPGAPWRDFKAKAKKDQVLSFQNAQNTINSLDKGGVCAKSKVVWYFSGGNGIWLHNADPGGGPGTLEPNNVNSLWSLEKLQGTPAGALRKYAATLDQKRTTIICSAAFVPSTFNGSVKITIKNNTTNNEVHSYTTEVTAPILATGGILTTPMVQKKTEFGKVYDAYKAIAKPTDKQTADFVAKAKAAIAKDKANPDKGVKITLNDADKAKLADGGVMNVTERAIKQPFTTNYTKSYKANFTKCNKRLGTSGSVTYKTDAEADAYIAKVKKNYGCETATKGAATEKYKVTTSTQTPQEIGFWQTLVVHCNSKGFNAIRELLGANADTVSQTSKEAYTGVLTTSKFDSKSKAARVMGGTLGAKTGSLSATGNLGFYDKECPYNCEPDPTTTNPLKTGAKVDGEDGVDFTMFRDNVDRVIEVQRWVPVNENGVKYDGGKALTTTVTLDKNSTPGTSATATSGGKFTLTDDKGNTIFGKDKVKTQKNWSSDLFNSINSGMKPGENTKFYAKASWASEDGKPVRLNFKWEYNPEVETTIPSDNLGFNSTGGKDVGTSSTVDRPIEGKCYGNFGEGNPTSTDTEELFEQNTGTGTTNDLDGNMLEGDTGRSDITITFLRSTTS